MKTQRNSPITTSRAPIGVVNATGAALNDATLKINAHSSQSVDDGVSKFSLPANARQRSFMNLKVGKFAGAMLEIAELTFVDSTGLRTVMNEHRRARAGPRRRPRAADLAGGADREQ